MFSTSCCACGADVKFDISTSEIHLYIQVDCNHLLLICPKGHSFRLFSSMLWLEAAQQRLPRRSKLDTNFHGNAPAEVLTAAETAWARKPLYEALEEALTRFGETGLIY